MKIRNPLTGRMEHISVVLNMLASQENCDGDPYDQMVEAALYIAKLEARVLDLQCKIVILGEDGINGQASSL